MKPESSPPFSSGHQDDYNNGHGSYGNNRIRVIRLRRRSNVPLGFSIRGGREHGTGIFVSEVRAGSEAHRQGLLVGDQIIRINGFNIEYAIHEEVLALLRAKPGVVIKVKSMGMIPVKDAKKDPLTWKIVDPGPSASSSSESNGLHSSCSSSTDESLDIKLSVSAIGASGLGCSIVKGPPDVPGIYIQSVKAGGLAEQTGLQVGDRIMEMNGHDFTSLDFSDAVAVLKSCKEMKLILRKRAGLDLFPEEKLKKSNQLQNSLRNGDSKGLSVVEEEGREERVAKKMNGQTSIMTNGTNLNHHNACLEQELVLNGHSGKSETDSSHSDVTEDDAPSLINMNHTIKVSATVHISDGDEEFNHHHNCITESSNRKEYESSSRNNRNHILNGFQSWNGKDYDTKECKTFIKLNEDNGIHSKEIGYLEEEAYFHDSMNLHPGKLNVLNLDTINGHKLDLLSEIQRHGDKSSLESDEKSERSSLSSDDYLGMPKINSKLECGKPQNEFLKRKQHELLMEEFREVHKKMFGQGPKLSKTPKPVNKGHDSKDQDNLYRRRQQIRDERAAPPPPPPLPPPDLLTSLDKPSNCVLLVHTQIEENTCEGSKRNTATKTDSSCPEPYHGTAYIPPLSPNPHMFVEPGEKVCEKITSASSNYNPASSEMTYKRRQREPPITDSRGPEPKPPQTYFDKPEGGPRPLVTIGTYPNNTQQNRFLCPESINIKSRQSQFESRPESTSVVGKEQLSISVHPKLSTHSSSASSTVPSSTSSEPRSPTSESVVSSDSLSNPCSPPSIRANCLMSTSVPSSQFPCCVPKNVHIAVTQHPINGKKPSENTTEKNIISPKSSALKSFVCSSKTNGIIEENGNKSQKMDLYEFPADETEGREIKKVTLKKNGPLHFRVEGGINSDPAGKIIVSEIWEGSCVLQGGKIELGDQILMVDSTKLTGLSLTAANVALRNASCNPNKEMILIIAKVPTER